MGVSPGTQAQTPPSEGKPSNNLKPDEIWEAALSNICLHVSFPCFICPRKASSQRRNLITILLKSMSGKKTPERKTRFLSFPAVSTRSGFSLILIFALCSPPGAQGPWTWISASFPFHRSASSKITFSSSLKSDSLHVSSPHKKVLTKQD